MAPSGSDIRVSRVELPALPELEREWRELQARSEHSFFMSWAWIGTWLAQLPAHVRPTLLRAEAGGRLVGLAVICARTIRRSRFIKSRALFLNCTGDPELDELTIEYDGFLADREREREITRRCIEFLAGEQGWDELFLDGWHRLDLVDDLRIQGLRMVTRTRSPCRFIDLAALRASNKPYLERLAIKVRYQIKRSLREVEGRGAVTFDAATSIEQASSFIADLKRLHQRSWQARGYPGSFANAFFDAFHAALVRSRFGEGVVQLLRLRVGDGAVGYLYNFLYGGRVYHYQSGLDFELVDGSRWTPGLVCHVRAVEFNKDAGQLVYDFMAGDHAYKKQLASQSSDMLWLTLQRPRLRFRLEDFLRSTKAKLCAALDRKGDSRAVAADQS